MPNFHIGQHGADVINYMTDHFQGFFNVVQTVLLHMVRWIYDVLTVLQPVALIAVLTVIALLVTRKLVLSIVLCVGLLLIVSMGLWEETMQSMALVLVASVIALLVGIPLGIWSAFSRVVRAVMQPVLDFMQTLPVFVYLIPMVSFFTLGVVPGAVATMVFAIPPAVRLTQLGIRQVDPDTVEAATAFGASKMEVLREVQLPLARPSIMAGVNQVIMLALSIVVVAGLVGGGGLGNIVVSSMQSLDIAASIEGGLAVVILAIYLDRVSAAAGGQGRGNPKWWPRRKRSAVVEVAAPEQRVTKERELVKTG